MELASQDPILQGCKYQMNYHVWYAYTTPLWNIQITLDGLAEDETTSF